MDKNIGRRLDGRYEITELIGVGGMADVYKANDLMENRTVAVKILKNEFAGNDDFVRRFRNESKAIAMVSHPNIVKIFDIGFSDKIQFIVMEYIDGITLKEFMEKNGVVKWKDSVNFITQILRALQHAHDRGIVHRDIKPQNIMLFTDGTIKVMDFGIARFAREEGKTISDKAIGSVHYISPEQARGDITDEKSDIYSVGVMLYEMLTGVKPFDAETPIAVALMHMQQNAKPPRAVNDTIPEGLEAIVMRAMQRDASKRYQSASEMIKDIEEFKYNPAIKFEYDFPAEDEGKTQYFDKVVLADKSGDSSGEDAFRGPRFKEEPSKDKKAAKDEVRKTKKSKKKLEEYEEYDYEDEDDEEEEEEVSKASYFTVALAAITAAVVIIAVVFIALTVMKIFVADTNQTTEMISLVGIDYNTAKSSYADYFTLEVESDRYSSEFPAGAIIEHSPKENSPIVKGDTVVKAIVSKGPQMVVVPNTYDIDMNTADSMIRAAQLFPSFVNQNSDVAKNKVIKTEPARNEEAERGSTVIVYVSLGPEIYDEIVPDVLGMNKVDALKLFESKGFSNVTLKEEDNAAEIDTIVAQSSPHLTDTGEPNIVSPDLPIVLTYSTGKAPMTELNITFAVPEGLKGKAVFNAYVNGNLSGTISVDNIGYVSTISIPVEGKDTQKVVLETVDSAGTTYSFAEYNVDFNTKSVAEVSFETNLLRTVYGEPEITTSPNLPIDPGAFSDPAVDLDPEIIGGEQDFTDWWANATGGR